MTSKPNLTAAFGLLLKEPTHFPDHILIDFIEGTLPVEQQNLIRDHLPTCPACTNEVHSLQNSLAEIKADPDTTGRMWSRLQAAITTQPEHIPSRIIRLQQFINDLVRSASDGAALLEQRYTEGCAALLSSLGAIPSYAGIRSDGSAPISTDSGGASPSTPTDPFLALREAIAHAFAAETLNSTFPGQEYDLQIRRLPDQPPVLRARQPGSNWQPFVLIASDATGQETRLDSTGDSLPLTQLAELPTHFTTLSIRFP